MKKLAIATACFFVTLSLLIYFNRDYKYKQYILDQKSTVARTYQVNVNLADTRAFDNLPGIGPSLAKNIVADREANGRFNEIEDLKRVKGIGEKKFATIKPYLTLEVI